MDENIFGWEMEEEIMEEPFANIYLRGGKLEERHYKAPTAGKLPVSTPIPGSNLNIGVSPGSVPLPLYESPIIHSLVLNQETRAGNFIGSHIDESLVISAGVQVLCIIQGMVKPPKPQGPHIYIAFPSMGAWLRGAYNSISNQFPLFGWAISRGLIHHRDLKFQARMWLDLVCEWLIPSQNKTEVPIEPLDKTVLADGMIILVTKTNRNPPNHEQALKIAMRPTIDKLRGLCATVEVLETEVITLRKDMATLTRPPPARKPTPLEPAAVTSQPEAPKSLPDDWWVGYDNASEMVSDEMYHSRLPPYPCSLCMK
ncbi:hypothetical protein HAX54_045927 [Datura stramonium]|uniref:Uncharacterized protein n=1 Tax=Datura stramonium TaxID=4076 RepID=A0ABS8WID2_DATST|nr:hypothetical protein [Datura stramonium]